MAETSSMAPTDAVPASDPAGIGYMDDESYKPLNGSWVAELEDAKEELASALRSQKKKNTRTKQQQHRRPTTTTTDADDETNDIDGHRTIGDADANDAVLCAYLRQCRAFAMLRQWDGLLEVSHKGTLLCSSTTTTGADALKLMTSFRNYRKTAKAEQHPDVAIHETIRHFVLNGGKTPRRFLYGMSGVDALDFDNLSIVLKEAVSDGDIRLMELAVALGSPIDAKGGDNDRILPPGVTPLLFACSYLGLDPDKDDVCPTLAEGTVECAMQLIRLGADPTAIMPQHEAIDQFRGMSAYQIAATSDRQPLISLMREHMQMSAKGRAEIVHCRCGSRLPWRQCHSTGAGQPSHCVIVKAKAVTYYRVSPHARCPCHATHKTYYQCCWTDSQVPVYMSDKTGKWLCRKADPTTSLPSLGRCLEELASQEPAVASSVQTIPDHSTWIRACARLFPTHPSLFAALCDDVGPKSRMAAWDPIVYAGCVERLGTPFLWKDVHWDLDRVVLCRQVQEWNEALLKHCDDAGLEGPDRDRLVSLHSANPCGPCGYGGCSKMERFIREFRRCSGCMAIAYCSRTCQKNDWSVHTHVCRRGSAPRGWMVYENKNLT